MRLYGHILWWDTRDQHGIIKDLDGRKVYFDVSSVDTRTLSKIKSGTVVRFEVNIDVIDALCARKVSIASMREKTRHEREVEDRRQLSIL